MKTTQNVRYGAVPVYDGATPTKASTAQYSYTFRGWSPTVVAATADKTYTATYNSTLRSYNITWKDDDGTTLRVDSVPYGETPSYGDNPTKATTAQYTYEFSGWNATVVPVTGAATYTAMYIPTLRSYTVTWADYDGTTLKTDTLDYGATPAYDGATPTRAQDAQYSYAFSKWSPDVTSVASNATYTATYTSTLRNYSIVWIDENGGFLGVDTLPYGTMPVYGGTTPTKESTVQYNYTFSGWTPALASVTGAATYRAAFSSTVRKYAVRWLDEDGTVLFADNVDYGTTPAYGGAAPTKEQTAQYEYSFSGWSPAVVAVTGAADYTATYSSTVRSYDITWKDEDGTTLRVDSVLYGETPAYGDNVPTKASTAQYAYEFAGWDAEVVAVTGTVTYTAIYTETVRSYDIVWQNYDGTELLTDSVLYGETPVYSGVTPTRTQDAQYKYTFAGWDAEIVSVTGPATYTATYSTTLRSYSIIWYDWDGAFIDTDVFFYGDTPEYYGAEPERDGYAFVGWFTSAIGGEPLTGETVVRGKMSFYAHWKQIRFLEGDVTCADGTVTLTATQAAWLNGFGDYETIKMLVAAMDAEAFEEAYLLNLDVTNIGRGYEFEVVGIDAMGAEVVVTVRLVRTGAVQISGGGDAPINGVLRLAGSATPAKGGFAPLAAATISDATFTNGDTTTLTFGKSESIRFFKACIVSP